MCYLCDFVILSGFLLFQVIFLMKIILMWIVGLEVNMLGATHMTESLLLTPLLIAHFFNASSSGVASLVIEGRVP